MSVDSDHTFQRVVLADCRGDRNSDARSGCVIDWEHRCLTEGTSNDLACRRAFASRPRDPYDRVCPCTADLTIDGTGGHWAYVTLEDQLSAACTLSPLPEHAGDGTCTSGDIPRDGRCDPQVCIAPFRCTPSTAYM